MVAQFGWALWRAEAAVPACSNVNAAQDEAAINRSHLYS